MPVVHSDQGNARRIVCAIVLTAELTVATPAISQSSVAPEKRALIVKLMPMTGAANIGKQIGALISRDFMRALKESRPDIPTRALEIVNEEVVAIMDENLGGFLDTSIPLYDKHFTRQEIADLIAFYQTPTGKKAIATMPKLIQEGHLAGQAWAKSLLPLMRQRLTERLQREGFN